LCGVEWRQWRIRVICWMWIFLCGRSIFTEGILGYAVLLWARKCLLMLSNHWSRIYNFYVNWKLDWLYNEISRRATASLCVIAVCTIISLTQCHIPLHQNWIICTAVYQLHTVIMIIMVFYDILRSVCSTMFCRLIITV
jgi:hypothetical protein